MHTGRNPQFTCYDCTCIVFAMYFQECTLYYVFWKNHGKHKVKSDCYGNCLVIKTSMRYAEIVKHKSIHNTLNIKLKFRCYNVKAYESRAR